MCKIKVYCFCTFFIVISTYFVSSKLVRHDDICGEFDGRRMYLELGEHGVLVAKKQNIQYDNLVNGKKLGNDNGKHKKCSLELITCPSCIITIKFTFLNISRNCGKNAILESCGCDYIWIYEPPFEDVSGEQFCGHFIATNSSNLINKSQTRSVAITFLYSNNHDHAFTLEYVSERNRHVINSYPKKVLLNESNNFIASPFFPHSYPRDLSIEYIINCKVVESCLIRLVFSDFQISGSSLIEFFDWNGQRMYVTTGSLFRPPVLISTGPSMVVRFYANGGTNLGFKANFGFILGIRDNSTLKPDTDCGGFVANLGGGITMMNMVKEGTQAYDCFWILRPPESYLHHKTHIYLKIIRFSDFVGSTELTVRQGATSTEPAVEILRYPLAQFYNLKQTEHVVSITQGFYVSLKGLFGKDSRLTIIYSTFSYKDCFSGSDFLCHNQRCIPTYLNCDGFDHCGDNSDEPIACIKEPRDRLWSHTPNFYFPKIDRFSDLKIATIVFVICSFGLITLIFVLILLLYRINTRSRCHGQLQSHLQTINSILEEGAHRIDIEEIVLNDDEPPIYEAPPDYEEALKLGMKPTAKKRVRRLPKSSSTNSENSGSVVHLHGESSNNPQAGISTENQTPNSPPPNYSLLPTIAIPPENISEVDVAPLLVNDSSLVVSNNDISLVADNGSLENDVEIISLNTEDGGSPEIVGDNNSGIVENSSFDSNENTVFEINNLLLESVEGNNLESVEGNNLESIEGNNLESVEGNNLENIEDDNLENIEDDNLEKLEGINLDCNVTTILESPINTIVVFSEVENNSYFLNPPNDSPLANNLALRTIPSFVDLSISSTNLATNSSSSNFRILPLLSPVNLSRKFRQGLFKPRQVKSSKKLLTSFVGMRYSLSDSELLTMTDGFDEEDKKSTVDEENVTLRKSVSIENIFISS